MIGFDHNPYLAGIDMLPSIYNAINYRQVLRIEYLPFDSGEPLIYVIHPYFLKQYNNRWFLFGFNPDTGRHNWNLALDRISSVEVLTDEYHENHEIDWNEYFDNIIGVTKYDGAEDMSVVLHFAGESVKYVETKPIHETQRSRRLPDGVLEVKLELLHNPELESVIMSFGENVRVVSPASLRDRIRERLKRALERYNTPITP
jgi:predicted DNA-binding transcriptional regulator YafY